MNVENDVPETFTREDMARAWDECALAARRRKLLHDASADALFETNPYRDLPPVDGGTDG